MKEGTKKTTENDKNCFITTFNYNIEQVAKYLRGDRNLFSFFFLLNVICETNRNNKNCWGRLV